jgi:hypothetical protein
MSGTRTLPKDPKGTSKPLVQVAILLDTSGSMEGLIEQAKSQLWDIVNELSTYRQNGQRPQLQVSLYEYGNSRVSSWAGYIRQISPLTTDLDLISSALFSLSTDGGEEYCGLAIETATQGLNWSSRPGDLKLIYIAGNEPFNQGSFPFSRAIKNARKQDIIVNTIYCGNPSNQESSSWVKGAQLAEGSFMAINHNHRLVDMKTPYDQRIQSLGSQLNKTYMAYGKKGKESLARQSSVDKKAQAQGVRSSVARAKAKSGGLYANAEWDLVDSFNAAPSAPARAGMVAEMEAEDLPAALQGMSPTEIGNVVAKKSKERKKIQEEIAKLTSEREAFLKAKSTKKKGSTSTLNDAVLQSLRKAAAKKGFKNP